MSGFQCIFPISHQVLHAFSLTPRGLVEELREKQLKKQSQCLAYIVPGKNSRCSINVCSLNRLQVTILTKPNSSYSRDFAELLDI